MSCRFRKRPPDELLEAGDMYEYMFYRNVGNDFQKIMEACGHTQGGFYAPLRL